MNGFAAEATMGAAALARGATTKNPFETVYSLVDDNPGADKQSLFAQFNDHAGDDPELQRAVNYWFFCNAHSYATTSRNRRADVEKRREAKVHQEVLAEKFVTQIVVLDLTMPNGKAMRDCTGAEMAKFGNRFQKLAERVGKTKTVGSVLNEDQVKEIMK